MPQGKLAELRVLFEMAAFHGWTAGALWDNTKRATHHFRDIDRLEMLGEEKWQEGTATLCKPFTNATVRYFDHGRGRGSAVVARRVETPTRAQANEHAFRRSPTGAAGS